MPSPPQWLKLIGKKIELSDALGDEDNILHMLEYPKKRIELLVHILEDESQILHVTAQHLKRQNDCL